MTQLYLDFKVNVDKHVTHLSVNALPQPLCSYLDIFMLDFGTTAGKGVKGTSTVDLIDLQSDINDFSYLGPRIREMKWISK